MDRAVRDDFSKGMTLAWTPDGSLATKAGACSAGPKEQRGHAAAGTRERKRGVTGGERREEGPDHRSALCGLRRGGSAGRGRPPRLVTSHSSTLGDAQPTVSHSRRKSWFPSPYTRPPFAPRSMGKAGALTPFLTLHGACPTTGKYPRKTEHQKITYLGRSFRFREIQVCGKHRGTFNTLQERQENAKDFWVGRVGKSFLERRGSSLMLSGGRVPGWCPHKCLP